MTLPASPNETNTSTDEELFGRFQAAGDREAFAVLVHRYERPLYGFLRRYLRDADLAEDVFQATFLRVYTKADRFEDGRRFRPWLYAVARNQAIDAARRRKGREWVSLDTQRSDDLPGLIGTIASGERSVDERLGDAESCQWVRDAATRLTRPHGRVVELVYGRGLKYREAAALLGIPVNTVKSRLHAAVQKLRQLWQAERGGLCGIPRLAPAPAAVAAKRLCRLPGV